MIYLQTFESYKKTDYLSGVALIVDNKILLIWPQKYNDKNNMWSLPKGHIEKSDNLSKSLDNIKKSDNDTWFDISLSSALSELREETGLELSSNFDYSFSVNYKKGSVKKIMDVFVYNLTKEDIKDYLEGDELIIRRDVLKRVRSNGEVKNINFFDFKEAFKKMEIVQRSILNEIVNRQG